MCQIDDEAWWQRSLSALDYFPTAVTYPVLPLARRIEGLAEASCDGEALTCRVGPYQIVSRLPHTQSSDARDDLILKKNGCLAAGRFETVRRSF